MKMICNPVGILLLLVGALALVACGDADNEETEVVFTENGNPGPGTEPGTEPGTGIGTGPGTVPGTEPGGTDPGPNPGPQTGFSGTWVGRLDCDLREETRDGVATDQRQLEAAVQFDGNEDFLLIGPNDQLQAQTPQGLTFSYVLDGGGTGSRQLVVFQNGVTTKRYEFSYTENRTNAESGSSSIYQRNAGEVYGFTLNGNQLEAIYQGVEQVRTIVSTEFGSAESNSAAEADCSGTLERR